MTNLLRTITVPEGYRPPVLEGPDVVTAIRVYGRAVEYALLIRQATFTVGSSPSCDLSIASEYLSSLHCLLERRGSRLRVHDQTSRNGTFFRGRRQTTFEIEPGDTFMLATTTLVAVNDHMRLARPVLAQILGYDQHPTLDDVLRISVEDGPLLILGPRGAGQLRLARAIHDASLRRGKALVDAPGVPSTREDQKALIESARRGTFVLAVTGVLLDEVFLDLVLSADSQVRLMILAPTLGAAMQSVRLEAMTRMSKVEIPPLRARPGDLGMLVDHLLVENRLSLRMTDLTAQNQQALHTYAWPENLEEVRQTIAWIARIVREGSIRKAASALGMPRSTLQYWMERLNLALPLTREGLTIEVDHGRTEAD